MLEGRHGGLVGTKALGEENGTSACLLPVIILAWDFTLKKWMGDGDWRIALAMD